MCPNKSTILVEAVAIEVTESEDVLVAKIISGKIIFLILEILSAWRISLQ